MRIQMWAHETRRKWRLTRRVWADLPMVVARGTLLMRDVDVYGGLLIAENAEYDVERCTFYGGPGAAIHLKVQP